MKHHYFDLIFLRRLTIIRFAVLICSTFLAYTGHSAPTGKLSQGRKPVRKVQSTPRRESHPKMQNDALAEAILLGDNDKIEGILKQGANINGIDSMSRTPLCWALGAYGDGAEILDTVRYLKNKGAALNPAGMAGEINAWTIQSAFSADNPRVIQALVNVYGAKFYRDYRANGQSPFLMAAEAGAPEAAQVLMDAGIDPNPVKNQLGETPLILIGKGLRSSISSAKSSAYESYVQQPPKELAGELEQAKEKEKSFIQKLAVRGANLNAQDSEGNTALIIAAEHGQTHLVQELLRQGANPNSKNQLGATALITVVTQGQQHIQKTMQSVEDSLRSEGTIKIPKAKSSETRKILMDADAVDCAVVKALLTGGAEPSIKDQSGKTALNYATSNNRSTIVRLLHDSTTVSLNSKSRQ